MNFAQGWYVAYTRSRFEKKIANKLIESEFDVYLPISTVISQWTDRKKKIEKPLFNSYVFVYLKSIKDYLKAMATEGIVLFISLGNKPVRVPDEEINRIRIFLNQYSEVELMGNHELNVGEKKLIMSGPFESYQCEILKINNKQKICVRIDSLKQSLIAEIHPYHLM